MKIGQNFLHELALIANQNGIERLELDCMKENAIGQSFYQKMAAFKKDFIDVYRLDVKDILAK